MIKRIASEPPFRMLVKMALRTFGGPASRRAAFDVSPRPAYLLGLIEAAKQAKRQKVGAISAYEFGVAGGGGLVALQAEAAAVEAETGIEIRVFGFDAGPDGLPDFIGDHRDHPDWWQPGDFPMGVEQLKARLSDRTELVLGNVVDTVPGFFGRHAPPPIGFVSIDVDLYSSTRDALKIFHADGRRSLWHVPMYFDDIEFIFNSRFGGELLAIDEFNESSPQLKIDKWYGLKAGRAFPESAYLDKMFVAHDLEAVSNIALAREARELKLPG